MGVVYVLRLKRGKWYVGWTKRNIERIWEHIEGDGAKWTKRYPPVEGREVFYMQDGHKPPDEDRITLETMAKRGVRNVRGGKWCKMRMSQKEISALEKKVKSVSKKPVNKSKRTSNKGFCIRCKRRKKYEFAKPLCNGCYDIWVEYSNPDYIEDHCHKCGKQWDTTIDSPLCISCWRKSR